ncbi:MAG: hypothetical protein JJE30_13530, partial [Desulfuromonadales bacterium]|nr:hypothetical protein [Desulfuromonadales bacterium]
MKNRTHISRLLTITFIALAVLLQITLQSGHAASISWTGAVSGNWSDTSKWSPNVVPTASDDVIVSVAGSYTITLDASPTINSLTLGGSGTPTFTASSRVVTVTNSATINTGAIVNLTSSTIAGSGLLTSSGTINLSSSSISAPLANSGTINAYGGSAINGQL